MKDLLSELEAWDLLQEHIDDVRASLAAGWNAWQDLGNRVPEHTITFDTTTRAGIVNNAIVAEARKRFFNVAGVNIKTKGRMMALVFGGKLILRFKKLDSGLRTRNIKTSQSERLRYQMELEGFPPDATVVVAGYLLNSLQDAVQGNWLVCSNGAAIEWARPLDTAAPPPATMFAGGTDPKTPPVRSTRVTKTAKEEAQGG